VTEGEHVSHHVRWWHLVDDDEAGLGLIEVMIAIFILGVALLALASVGTTSLISLRVTRDREQATNAASAAIEAARAVSFRNLAIPAGTVDVSQLPDGALPTGSTNSCVGEEPVVTDAVTEPPFAQDVGNQDRIRVYTLVTYAETDCSVGGPTELKRVIAVATWSDQGQTHHVKQETLVVAAGRGLPVPRFEVRPPESSLSVSQTFLGDPAETDKRRCVEHQLRNLGADDSYEWQVETDSSGVPPIRSGSGYSAGDWLVTAFLELPTVPSRAGDPPPSSALMDAATESSRPGSDEVIEPGETATFTVCYEPVATPDETGPWPEALEATVAVHSRFDDRQVKRVVHDVTAPPETALGDPLFLFDPDDSTAHARRVDGAFLPSLMGPRSSDPNQISFLGTIDYTQTSRSNWSTDIGANNYPGTRFNVLSTMDRQVGISTMAWHYQFPAKTTLRRDATLVLWHAPTNGIAGGPSLPEGGQPVTLEVRVDALGNNEKTVSWTGITAEYTYTHSTTGWRKLEIPLDLGQDEQEFASGRYLRLRLTCGPMNSADCNLAYDNVAHPSALYVRVK
jgi:type II secretory pathway pseudopilin PulG